MTNMSCKSAPAAKACCFALWVRRPRLLPRSQVQSIPPDLSMFFCPKAPPPMPSVPLTPLSKYICDVLAVKIGNGARSAETTSACAAAKFCCAMETSKFWRAASSTWASPKVWACTWAPQRAVSRSPARIGRRKERNCRMLIPRLSLFMTDQSLTWCVCYLPHENFVD